MSVLKDCSQNHGDQTKSTWSQDGWASRCRQCGEIIYHGDDYDNPPSNALIGGQNDGQS